MINLNQNRYSSCTKCLHFTVNVVREPFTIGRVYLRAFSNERAPWSFREAAYHYVGEVFTEWGKEAYILDSGPGFH